MNLNILKDKIQKIKQLHTTASILKFVSSTKRIKMMKYLKHLKNMAHAMHTSISFDKTRELHLVFSCDRRFCKSFITRLNKHLNSYEFSSNSRVMIFGKQSWKAIKNAELYQGVKHADDALNIALQIIDANLPNIFIHSYINDHIMITDFSSFAKFKTNHHAPTPSNDEIQFCLSYWIRYFIIENSIKEQSERTEAMTDASNNAEKMLDRLTLDASKARQSQITSQVISIK